MGISKGYAFEPAVASLSVGSRLFSKANILINRDGHACIADFSLLAIIPDHTNLISTISNAEGGTIRWMSPELLNPGQFGLKDSYPTKESDCYALGMVIYEVLGGQVPFAQYKGPVVILKVTGGERPERPQGMQAAWFTDDLWEILGHCWKPYPHERPSLKTLLEYLEGVTQPSRPPSPTSTASEDVVTSTDDLLDPNLGGSPLPSPDRTVIPPPPRTTDPPSTPGEPSLARPIYPYKFE